MTHADCTGPGCVCLAFPVPDDPDNVIVAVDLMADDVTWFTDSVERWRDHYESDRAMHVPVVAGVMLAVDAALAAAPETAAERDRLLAANAAMLDALRFYAEKGHYYDGHEGYPHGDSLGNITEPEPPSIFNDEGAQARAAIAAATGGTGARL